VFKPNPRIESVPLFDGHFVHVIDDALERPDDWVALAARHAAEFEIGDHNAYPGPELRIPDSISAQLDAYFLEHVRARLGARRTLRMYSRLAMVTLAPAQLAPRQWICHRDRFDVPADQCVAASVVYLFRDPAFGGTSFYRPRRPGLETDLLVHESGTLSGEAFSAKYGIAPGYQRGSNDWFEHVLTVPPRWNRAIFYDGSLFHCSDIPDADPLSSDPSRGRLTMNGFFTCSRRLG